MPMVRAMRLLNAIEAGYVDSLSLDQMLQADPGRVGELRSAMNLRGQMRRMTASTTAMNAIAGSSTAVSLVLGSTVAVAAIAGSRVAMNAIVSTPGALSSFIADYNATIIIANSSEAMSVLSKSTAARTALLTSSAAMKAISTKPTAVAKLSAGLADIDPDTIIDVGSITDKTLITTISTNADAVKVLADSKPAFDLVIQYGSVQNALFGSSVARQKISESSNALSTVSASQLYAAKMAFGYAGLNPDILNSGTGVIFTSNNYMDAIAGSASARDFFWKASGGKAFLTQNDSSAVFTAKLVGAYAGIDPVTITIASVLTSSTSLMNAVLTNSVALEAMASSNLMIEVANSETAMNAIVANQNAFSSLISGTSNNPIHNFHAKSTAMNAIASNADARTVVLNNKYVFDYITAYGTMAVAKLICGFAGLDPKQYGNFENMVGSGTVNFATIAGNPSAMKLIAASKPVLTVAWGSGVVLDSFRSNPTAAKPALLASPHAKIVGGNNVAAIGRLLYGKSIVLQHSSRTSSDNVYLSTVVINGSNSATGSNFNTNQTPNFIVAAFADLTVGTSNPTDNPIWDALVISL